MVMENTRLSVTKFTLLFSFLFLVVITSSCDLLTGYAVKVPIISEPIYIRCSDTAGLTVMDYCQINNTIKFLFVNRQYVSIEGVLVTLVTEHGNFQKDFIVRLNPTVSQLVELEYPEMFSDFAYVEFRPSSFDPNGVISPCRKKLLERESIRTCVYN